NAFLNIEPTPPPRNHDPVAQTTTLRSIDGNIINRNTNPVGMPDKDPVRVTDSNIKLTEGKVQGVEIQNGDEPKPIGTISKKDDEIRVLDTREPAIATPVRTTPVKTTPTTREPVFNEPRKDREPTRTTP